MSENSTFVRVELPQLFGSSTHVDNPPHYTEGRAIQPWDVAEDWKLGYCLGSVVKYIARAGRKGERIEDLEKALRFLKREIELEKKRHA